MYSLFSLNIRFDLKINSVYLAKAQEYKKIIKLTFPPTLYLCSLLLEAATVNSFCHLSKIVYSYTDITVKNSVHKLGCQRNKTCFVFS